MSHSFSFALLLSFEDMLSSSALDRADPPAVAARRLPSAGTTLLQRPRCAINRKTKNIARSPKIRWKTHRISVPLAPMMNIHWSGLSVFHTVLGTSCNVVRSTALKLLACAGGARWIADGQTLRRSRTDNYLDIAYPALRRLSFFGFRPPFAIDLEPKFILDT